eukprot:12200313-Alexandrium_andersonii.AAC.1
MRRGRRHRVVALGRVWQGRSGSSAWLLRPGCAVRSLSQLPVSATHFLPARGSLVSRRPV